MTDEIDVKKVAKLARITLGKEEEAYFEEKFRQIIEFVGKISEVDISSDMEEKDESLQKIYQKDIRHDSDVSPNQFSENLENKFFKVPKVIE